ncbi:MAG: DUF547 domain-containing protein [Alphaproteobacteria bacterium]|nr:DUF547 domain-containing protein [Alphaproteobacteria bacterium]
MNETPAKFGPPRSLDLDQWDAAWADVLAHHVDARGRVDFLGLASDRTGLDEVIKFIAAVDPASSPEQFPTPNARLAYYLNAYNALAMYGVLDAGVPKRFGWFGRIRFFVFRKFTMGGRTISLYGLENSVIRPLGDPRVHFALNCMSVSCPRLPQSAFTANALDEQLAAAAREFVAEKRNVDVDDGRKELRISGIFKFYTKDFLAKAPSLATYINQYRLSPVRTDYKIVFDDYDWSINDQGRR